MTTQFNLDGFEFVPAIEYYGKKYKSFYNHNYYYNVVEDILVGEICNDDDFFEYYRCNDGK